MVCTPYAQRGKRVSMDSVIKDTPSIGWNGSRSNHPARIASYRALDAITCADKEGYISLYAPDGVIHDPVGMTAVDPTGAGHRGHDAISAFWDATIARAGGLNFIVHKSHATHDQVANSYTITPRDPCEFAGIDCIFIYRVNDGGLLVYVGGYWDIPEEQELPS